MNEKRRKTFNKKTTYSGKLKAKYLVTFFLYRLFSEKTLKPNIHFRRFFVLISQQYFSVMFLNGFYIFPSKFLIVAGLSQQMKRYEKMSHTGTCLFTIVTKAQLLPRDILRALMSYSYGTALRTPLPAPPAPFMWKFSLVSHNSE